MLPHTQFLCESAGINILFLINDTLASPPSGKCLILEFLILNSGKRIEIFPVGCSQKKKKSYKKSNTHSKLGVGSENVELECGA
jgi:hypothetical protein